jgi:hypothetical protein
MEIKEGGSDLENSTSEKKRHHFTEEEIQQLHKRLKVKPNFSLSFEKSNCSSGELFTSGSFSSNASEDENPENEKNSKENEISTLSDIVSESQLMKPPFTLNNEKDDISDVKLPQSTQLCLTENNILSDKSSQICPATVVSFPTTTLMTEKDSSIIPLRKSRTNSLTNDIRFGFAEHQGKRKVMEDRTIAIPCEKKLKSDTNRSRSRSLPDLRNAELELESLEDFSSQYSFFGVYDGHGGLQAVDYVNVHLHDNIVNSPYFFTDTSKAIEEGFEKTDREFIDVALANNYDGGSGTTTCIAIIRGNVLYVANVGDSECFLCRNGLLLFTYYLLILFLRKSNSTEYSSHTWKSF